MSTTIETAVKTLRESSESIDTSKPISIPADMEIGDAYPQGDIALWRIESIPKGAKPEKWLGGDFQLSPGTTQGSRHCIPAQCRKGVKVFRVNDGDALSDLCIEAAEAFDLVHPEHAHHIGYPPGCYRVLHQQNEQRQRVVD